MNMASKLVLVFVMMISAIICIATARNLGGSGIDGEKVIIVGEGGGIGEGIGEGIGGIGYRWGGIP